MQKTLIALSAALVLGFAPLTAAAQTAHGHGHAAAASPAAPDDKTPESVRGFQAANDRMHADMNIKFTGNADADFARGMIPHHQGAIDMANVVLAHGADPEMRKLAQEIIAAQEGEIRFLKEWLKRHGH